MSYSAYFYSTLFLLGSGLFLTVYTLGQNRPADSPTLGRRGKKRLEARQEGGLFATVEPAIRWAAGWVAYLPIPEQRRRLDTLLKHGGDWLGLTPNEFIAISGLAAIAMGATGYYIAELTEQTHLLVLIFFAFGAASPYLQLQNARDERFKKINRGLPGAIDLASLCMGAGLDFPGSLRQIVDKSGSKADPLVEEWEYVLQELDLGRTRRQALENLADRAPTEPVLDFVNAVVQAEQKGNPLAEVLRIQAQMSRMRRSVMAEEAAARAAVKMMGPLMMIFLTIMICLMGPFAITAMTSGL